MCGGSIAFVIFPVGYWAGGLRRGAEVRLRLVAPDFSPELAAALSFVEGVEVLPFRYDGRMRRPERVKPTGAHRRSPTAEQARFSPEPEYLDGEEDVVVVTEDDDIEALELAWVVPVGRS